MFLLGIKKKLENNTIILLFIILLAVILRLYAIDSVPPNASLDEASIGYNAYSILKTGKDEYGNYIPFLLRAYDDWRPGLYVYLVIPFIFIFDLSVTAVRFPSVLLSISSLVLTYYLVKELFHRKTVALLAIFFLAISPWNIYISRLGHEVNLGYFFTVLGMFSFVKALKTQRPLFFFCIFTISFALSMGSYQSEKIIAPVLGISLLLIFFKEIWLKKREFLIACIVGLIFFIPTLQSSFSPNALIRFNATNAFNENDPRYYERAKLLLEAKKKNNFLAHVYYNRRLTPIIIASSNYFSHFNPIWLTTNGGEERHKVPNLGLLYSWECILFLLGIFFLWKSAFSKKTKLLLLMWLLTAPLPAAITTDAPHAMRIYTSLPVWQIYAAFGLFSLIRFIQSRKVSIIPFTIAFTFIIIASILKLSLEYFYVFPREQSDSFQYPLKQAILFSQQNEEKYSKIIFSNENDLMQSYMHFLFHTKYDPAAYLSAGGTKSGGFAESHAIKKYFFQSLRYISLKQSGSILVIANKNEDIDGNKIKSFYNKKGEKRITAWEL